MDYREIFYIIFFLYIFINFLMLDMKNESIVFTMVFTNRSVFTIIKFIYIKIHRSRHKNFNI